MAGHWEGAGSQMHFIHYPQDPQHQQMHPLPMIAVVGLQVPTPQRPSPCNSPFNDPAARSLTTLPVVQYSYGVFLAVFVKEFPDVSITLLAAVGSISTGVMELSAVISGYSQASFGESETCFIGGILAAVALFLASFSTQ
ncbi:hypothetical protein T484DRAFT_1842873, partial [Baffinella frigidus]